MLEIIDRIKYAKLSLDGLALGDCFGQTFFKDSDTAKQRIKAHQIQQSAWHFTDDTVMGIGIYRLLEQYGDINQDKLANVFGKNYLLDWHRGYGGTAHSILRALGEGEDWKLVAPKAFEGMGSMGNGAAMRAAPIGAYFADDLQQVALQAKRSAEVTHSHTEGIVGAIAVAIAAAQMLNQRLGSYSCSPEQFLTDVAAMLPESDTKYKILAAIPIKKSSTVEFVVSVLGNGMNLTAQDTVPFSLWCACHYQENLEDALWKAVSALGDRDTICAIVGSIVALYNKHVPEIWMEYIEHPEDTEFFTTAC